MGASLRPLLRRHAADVDRLLADPAVHAPAAVDELDRARYVQRAVDDNARGRGAAFAIFDGATLVGVCRLRPLGGGEAELAVWLGRAHWGRGLARQAVRALVDHAFSEERLRALTARCLDDNARALRLFASLGFAADGSATDELGRRVRAFRLDQTSFARSRIGS